MKREKRIHPGLHTVTTKEGVGASVISLTPNRATKLIKNISEKSLNQDLEKAKITLPDEFRVEICYRDHTLANSKSYYPGMKKLDSNTLLFETNDYYEVLRMLKFAK